MAISPWKKIKLSLLNANQLFGKKPDKALEEAYNEALAIAALEKEYFDGQKICPESGNYTDSAQSYFNSQ
ncbi:MAG: proton extrusion protein PcxA, partial [Cyanobacteriota bacterium]|nr:proton extrusion protein PcxA [Cyanobacteriota bacterium]